MDVPELFHPQYSASYCTRAVAQISLEPAVCCENQQVIDQSYLHLAEIEKWYKSHMIEARSIQQRHAPCMMATPPVIAHVCMSISWERAFRLFICGFNFRGSPINHKNRENWLPRKFPAIRYYWFHSCMHVFHRARSTITVYKMLMCLRQTSDHLLRTFTLPTADKCVVRSVCVCVWTGMCTCMSSSPINCRSTMC